MVSLQELRERKVADKTEFTRRRRALLVDAGEEFADPDELKHQLDEVTRASDNALGTMLEISKVLSESGKDTEAVFQEIAELDKEYNHCVDRVSDKLAEVSMRPSRAKTGTHSPVTLERARAIKKLRDQLSVALVGDLEEESQMILDSEVHVRREFDVEASSGSVHVAGTTESLPVSQSNSVAVSSVSSVTMEQKRESALVKFFPVAMATGTVGMTTASSASGSNFKSHSLPLSAASAKPYVPANGTVDAAKRGVPTTAQSSFGAPPMKQESSVIAHSTSSSLPLVAGRWAPTTMASLPPAPAPVPAQVPWQHGQNTLLSQHVPPAASAFGNIRRPPVPPVARTATYSMTSQPAAPGATAVPGIGSQPVSYNYVPVQYPPYPQSFNQNPPMQYQQPPQPQSQAPPTDIYRQLKKIEIPQFSGDKQTYESWKAAFEMCIGQAYISDELKLLQLRQYLSGEALKAVESLGYSAGAYTAALRRLERKYGGDRRRVTLHLEALEKMPPIRGGKARELERFVELLDTAVVNLKASGHQQELSNGLFYVKLQKKLSMQLLTSYEKWLEQQQLPENVENLLTWLEKEAELMMSAQETIEGMTAENNRRGGKPVHSQSQAYFTASSGMGNSRRSCVVCGDAHAVWNCPEFASQSAAERWKTARAHRLCFRCLGEGHRGSECRWRKECGVDRCKDTHNRLLHPVKSQRSGSPAAPMQSSGSAATEGGSAAPAAHNITAESLPPANSVTAASSKSNASTHMGHLAPKPPVMLRTVPVLLRAGDRRLQVNALLDDGSTHSYINANVAAELGLSAPYQTMSINTLNGRVETLHTMEVSCQMESVDGQHAVPFSALTAERVTGDLEHYDWTSSCQKYVHLQHIDFPEAERKPVEVLIGLDNANLHRSLEERCGAPGEPLARRTPLGWTCVGSVATGSCNFARVYFARDDLCGMVKRMWEVEALPAPSEETPYSKAEREVLQETKSSIRFADGKYEVGLPWKSKPPDCNHSFDMALKRLKATERRLSRDPFVAGEYSAVIQRHLEKGYISKVEASPDQGWYLPHFAVTRPEATTTKVRVVFDAAAKADQHCLNDYINPGPKLQAELPAILTRFRKNPVALVADVAEMYLQIKIPDADRQYHQFLWRDINAGQEPTVYQYNRVVFGVNASPFLAQLVSQQHARKHQKEYPRAAEVILKSTYMDDSMDSVADNEEAVALYQELKQLWNAAGMHPRKWLSNSLTVLAHVPEEDRAKEVNLECGVLPTSKTLGVTWQANVDEFTFKTKTPVGPISKRTFLKNLATVFDPLGFVLPFIVSGRVIFQQMWLCGADWDDILPSELAARVERWYGEMDALQLIKVPRCLRCSETVVATEVHVFTDASQDAYGAVSYIRHVYQSGVVSCRFVAARAKVSPLSATSIPRLELMGAVIGTRLALSVAEVLGVAKDNITFWSDSMNVLWWIRNHSRSFKPFVANRIAEIQDSTQPAQWRYVNTSENPADIVSRGASASELASNALWWSGPSFLCEQKEQWPSQPILQKAEHPELRATALQSGDPAVTSTTLLTILSDGDGGIVPENFSSWRRLIRVTALVLRFVANCRLPIEDRCFGELRPVDIVESESHLIRAAQQESFTEYALVQKGKPLPASSPLVHLSPVLDENGLMRINGRLQNAEFLSFDAKHPILLPRRSWITTLIVRGQHEAHHHAAGVNQVLASLMNQYWILHGREVVKQVEQDCKRCRLRKSKPASQVMGPLPQIRLKEPLRAFGRVAVDFAGPFITVQGRGIRRAKRYLCLFTCLSCRGVHLEMATALDADSFLRAFQRMISRRGVPDEVLSDNGTNFVGAEKELKEVFSSSEQQLLQTKYNRIKWQFIPPLAPHFGGVHESMIKSAKRAIFAILSQADITDEELQTSFCGAEALLNSRPIVSPSSDHRDDLPLTPNDFIVGRAQQHLPPTEETLQRRWRRIQELISHFWKRWLKEWVPALNRRQKWTKEEKNVKVDDVVLVVSSDSPRGSWPLARVVEVFPGSDGNVRVAKLKLGGKEVLRPIVRLCPIVCE